MAGRGELSTPKPQHWVFVWLLLVCLKLGLWIFQTSGAQIQTPSRAPSWKRLHATKSPPTQTKPCEILISASPSTDLKRSQFSGWAACTKVGQVPLRPGPASVNSTSQGVPRRRTQQRGVLFGSTEERPCFSGLYVKQPRFFCIIKASRSTEPSIRCSL